MRGPSDEAVEAVAQNHPWGFSEKRRNFIAREVIEAAYPHIIAEVVEALREGGYDEPGRPWLPPSPPAATFIEREFGEVSK